MKVGDPKAADTDLGPVSSLQHREKVPCRVRSRACRNVYSDEMSARVVWVVTCAPGMVVVTGVHSVVVMDDLCWA